MSDTYFEFSCPVKVVAGFRALEHLAFEVGALGARQPLLVTDAGVRQAGLAELVAAALEAGGVRVGDTFDGVPPDSSTSVVAEVAARYRAAACDAIVAVGGGSVMDTAKAANILVSEGGDDVRAYQGAYVLGRRLRPLLVLPTTSGTGSEVTAVSVVRDDRTGVKLPFVSQHLYPDVAVLDPRLTMGLPKKLTAATAMDAMTHACEAFTCLAKNPLSDAYATAAIKKIAAHLPRVLRDNEPAGRLELAVAATMAGIAFSSSMVGLVHSLGHAVGAVCHVHHGVCMSVLLPHVLEYNLDTRRETIGELLLPLAGADAYARTPAAGRGPAAIAALRALAAQLHDVAGLPRTLAETGQVRRDQLPEIARLALDDGSLMTNPKEVRHADALAVLERAF